ncbi:MAG: Glycogen phosphorylase [Parcubacteria group bacterium GW2011_GWA2_40_8]|nr:MAG: Glycogen phosphorylase [Parcubacteria group bacterium GW2011_GWB1_40_14]KKR78672.1 MAG: Glycogen phosphorylase [Parcubacteria group bacterium GW2011_GWA2_40_8]
MNNFKSRFKFLGGRRNTKLEHVSKDLVCGMASTDGIDFVYTGIKYSFCSDYCRQQFQKNPEDYIIK